MTRFLIASRRAAAITAVALMAACSGLLDVDNPNAVVEDALSEPGSAPSIANGAGATVTRALTAILAPYGAVTDELTYVGSRDAYGYADRGEVSDPFNEFADAAFPEMAEARWTTAQAVRRLKAFDSEGALANKNDLARALLYESIIFTSIGEMFDDFVIDASKDTTSPPVGEGNMSIVFDSAITQTTQALALPTLTKDNKIVLLAMRARARHSKAIWAKLNGANGAPAQKPLQVSPYVNSVEADNDARDALVEMGAGDYKFKLTPRAETLGFPLLGDDLNNRSELRSGDSQAGIPSAQCRDATCDTYVVPTSAGNKIASTKLRDPVSNIIDPVFQANVLECCMRPGGTTGNLVPLTIISAREMLLIRAEHALANGNTAGFTTFINQIRAFNSTLTPYNGTSPAPLEMLKHTRLVNLYNQGKRLMDMHRFDSKARKWVPEAEAYAKACFFPVMNIERSTHPDDFQKPLCRP